MPFPLLAHQAPVLPLKIWRPRWFDGTALVFGSMAPDLPSALTLTGHGLATAHTFVGQFTVCLPLGLALTYVTTALLAAPLARRLPAGPPWHLADIAALSNALRTWRDGVRAAASVLVGSFSHVLLDGFTHVTRWSGHTPVSAFARAFRIAPAQLAVRLQYTVSIAGSLLALALLARIARRRSLRAWSRVPIDDTLVNGPRRASWYVILPALAAAAFTAVHTRRALRHPSDFFQDASVYVWGYIVFRAACAAFLGLCAGCMIAQWVDKRAAR